MNQAVRWVAKKAARQGVALGGMLAGRTGAHAAEVRVLTYHRFDGEPRNPFSVDPHVFDAQMAWLAQERRAVSLDAIGTFLRGEGTLPDGAVLVTIDDGCRSTLTGALPILERHGIPAVAFVPAGLMGKPPSETAFGEATMDWSEVAALASRGVVIGAHGWSHRSLGRLSEAEAREEGVRARRELEDRLGVETTAFAYPFGTRQDFNDGTERALRDAGYRFAFTSQHGAIRGADDPLSLPRIKVESGEGLWMFRLLCQGGLDAWRLVDQALWRLQAVP